MNTAAGCRTDRLKELMCDAPDKVDRELRACAEIACRIYSSNRGKPEVLRKAEFLAEFAAACPVRVREGELVVGPHFPLEGAWSRWRQILGEDRLKGMDFHGNIGHIVVDYGRVLRLGVEGLLHRINEMPGATDAQTTNREAFRTTVQAFSRFMRRYGDEAARLAASRVDPPSSEMREVAETCLHIASHPPRTFRQALQMVWFMQVFMHAESMAQAVSFGRFDQYLGPYLESDFANGLITTAEAEELLACFWTKCNSIGDPSQNLVVGGVDADGRCAENALSFLCLDAARQLRLPQPSVSVRIGPTTSEEFWEKALALCAAGFGMPSFFNDPVVIRSLEGLGIPPDRSRDWGIVGCYEANPQGDTYGLTVGGGFSLPEVFLSYLDQASVCDGFDNFLAGFKRHLAEFYRGELPKFQATVDRFAGQNSSPFESVCLGDCIENGRTAEEGGARFNLFGVNIMGLGTLVDSFLVLKELVFERQEISLEAFRQQLAADFVDETLLTRCRNLEGKYGTGSAFTDALARDLLAETAALVHSHPLRNGVRPYPGFFWFLQDVYKLPRATPDGRRNRDRVSYGVGPSVLGDGRTATSILLSAARLAHDRCPCGNPLTLSLNHGDVKGIEGASRLRHLIETYFREGGFHLHFNIVDARELRAAKERPQEHPELTVRISGYSAKFTGLDSTLQDAIIERTEKGM